MSPLARFLPVAVGAITLAGACGGDSTGPSATSVTGIAGDGQAAITGEQLAFPLSFIVLGSSGQPVQGVTVSWTVTPAGGATFAPVNSTTDAQGTAATTVTLGAVVGDLVILGNVPGLQPVVFHAQAVSACTYIAPYTLGAAVNGTLATTDCNRSGFLYDYYQLDLPSGQHSLRIGMASSVIDAWVDLFRSGNLQDPIGFDDDIQSGVITDSQLDIILTGGSYVIGANSFDPGEVGPYTMSAATRPATFTGCQLVWLVRGVTVTDAIAPDDCVETTVGTDYFDPVALFAEGGTVLSIAQRSTAFNTKLEVYTGAGVLQVENDDSLPGSNTNSFVSFTVPATGPYVVLIGSSGLGETGAYTIEVYASTTLAGAAGASRSWQGATPLPAAPFRLPKTWRPLPRAPRSH